MRRITTCGALILLLALPVSAMELSLEDCLRLTEQNDREVKAAQAREEARGEEVSAARKNFLPELRMEASYTLLDRPNRLIIDADAFGTGLPAEDIYLYGARRFRSASLILEQPLFQGGALRHELNRSQRQADQARFETERHKSLARRNVEELFLRTLNAQLLRESLKKTLAGHQERLRILRERRAEGYEQEEDLLRQQTELAFAEVEVQRAEIREKVAIEQLKNALYLNQPTGLVLRAPRRYQRLISESIEGRETSLTARGDYMALEQQVLAADAQVEKARARLFPEISLFGQYTRQDDTNLDRDEVWSTGATLEWSIFEWGKNLSEIRRAQAERQSLNHRRAAQLRAMNDEVENLWGKAREQTLLIDAWELKIRLSQRVLQRTQAEFSEGRNTLAEVLAQESQLLSVYSDYRREINELGITLAYLKAALGSPLDEWLEEREILPLEQQPKPMPAPEPPPRVQAPSAPASMPRTSAKKTTTGHTIQIGAFTDRANAEALQNRATAVFPKQEVKVDWSEGTYKVLIAGLADQEAAHALLPTIRRKLAIDGFFPRSDP